MTNRLALFGNLADDDVDAYFVLEHAGGHLHSAPDECWAKVVEESIGRTESKRSEALAKQCRPSQSHVDMLFYNDYEFAHYFPENDKITNLRITCMSVIHSSEKISLCMMKLYSEMLQNLE